VAAELSEELTELLPEAEGSTEALPQGLPVPVGSEETEELGVPDTEADAEALLQAVELMLLHQVSVAELLKLAEAD
jgi:hypothetical protein